MSVSRTNQTLFFVKTALKLADEATSSQEARRNEEAALFHLYSALFSLFNEVCQQYNLSPITSLDVFLGQDSSSNSFPIELNEVRQLIQDYQSWLSQFIATYKRMLVQGLENNQQTVNVISSQSDFNALIRKWLIELENLIAHHREFYQEN